MRFAIQHAVALLDGGLADGLGQVTLARTAGAEKEGVFPLAEEGAGGQVEDQTTIHFRIEGEVEVVQRLVGVAERSLFAPPVEQPLAAPTQLVGDQARDQIDRRHRFGLGLSQAGFQYSGDAAEPELSQGTL